MSYNNEYNTNYKKGNYTRWQEMVDKYFRRWEDLTIEERVSRLEGEVLILITLTTLMFLKSFIPV